MQPPIGDYAIVGDCRSAALISRAGAVDFLCWPRFDSGAVFAALLDEARGGSFRVAPRGVQRTTRAYAPGSNVLVTRFAVSGGEVTLTDFMPALTEEEKRSVGVPEHSLLRLCECTAGEVVLDVACDPRPDFGRARVRARATSLGIRFESPQGLLLLSSSHPLRLRERVAHGEVRLRAGESLQLALGFSNRELAVLTPLGDYPRLLLSRTLAFWRAFSARAQYEGPFRDEVVRSALLLKLLTYAPSGAVVAAPTTSLPERPGGPLNWDYRYCWLRDAALTSRALFGLGYDGEAEAFVSWLLTATSLTRPRVSVLYDVFGNAPPAERTLAEFSGYRGARPVRLGNAARDQLQLDVYGELVEAAAHFVRAGGSFDRETSRFLLGLGHIACDRYREPDDGIWEIRGAPQEFTHSRVLCWAALDRLLELAGKKHLACARPSELARFAAARAEIRSDVEARGIDPVHGNYVRTLGGRDLDASLLLLPWYGYVAADAPRMKRTWARIESGLGRKGGLLRRYEGELTQGEGAFGICSFWAAEYLAQGGGTLAEAELAFKQLLHYRNDVGLFAEEIDEEDFSAQGNFPQAYTHVGLISAALRLEERRRGEQHGPTLPRRDPQPAPGERL